MLPLHIEANTAYQARRDKALRLAPGAINKYSATPDHCACPDAMYRAPQGWCKHRIAARIEEDRYQEERRRQWAADPTLGGLYP